MFKTLLDIKKSFLNKEYIFDSVKIYNSDDGEGPSEIFIYGKNIKDHFKSELLFAQLIEKCDEELKLILQGWVTEQHIY